MSLILTLQRPNVWWRTDFSKMCLPVKTWCHYACLLLAIMFFGEALVQSANAAEVQARLLQESTQVGRPVYFEIRVDGSKTNVPPPKIRVDGLDISSVGSSQSSQFVFNNGGLRTQNETTHNYEIVPGRSGVFTIPAVEIEVDGRTLRTQPVTLRVENGSGSSGGNDRAKDQVTFAEIVLPKKTAYVGEIIPVEVRLFVNSEIRSEVQSMPTIEGDGFTKTKMTQPRREQARRDGHEYNVLVFQTAITPSKAGKVQVGPSEIPILAQVPRAKPNRQRSPFGGYFGDDFFNEAFGRFGAVQERVAKAKAAELEVKPLPSAGRPANFSGAVGSFTLSSEGSPATVKVGDPLTMTISVSGRGNFDRIGAPVLADQNGWRAYPPSNEFKPEDDVNMRGTKVFQMAVIPETKKTAMPQFEFSYFDPQEEKYVTLKTEPDPLNVEGSALPPPAPVPARPAQAQPITPPAAPNPEKPAQPTDILGLRYEPGQPTTFTPIYEKRGFWLAQLVPLVVLLGLLGSRLRRTNAEARELAALKRERNAQLARLQREKERSEFLDAAARAIQLETALATGQSPAVVDASEACRSRKLDAETVAAVQAIFDSRAELLYAGDGHGREPVSSTERDRVLATVAQFEKSHGRN